MSAPRLRTPEEARGRRCPECGAPSLLFFRAGVGCRRCPWRGRREETLTDRHWQSAWAVRAKHAANLGRQQLLTVALDALRAEHGEWEPGMPEAPRRAGRTKHMGRIR